MFGEAILKCPCCSEEFSGKYDHGGFIDHENTYSNIKVMISRWKDKSESQEDTFLWSIGMDGNHCNIKDNNFYVSMQKLNCVISGLKEILSISDLALSLGDQIDKNSCVEILSFLKSKTKRDVLQVFADVKKVTVEKAELESIKACENLSYYENQYSALLAQLEESGDE